MSNFCCATKVSCVVSLRDEVHDEVLYKSLFFTLELTEFVSVVCACTGECRFKCRKDGEQFATIVELRKHVQLRHPTDWPYRCTICGKIWHRACELRLHMTKHNSDRPYLCSHCGKTFPDSTQLRSHMRVHVDDRPHFCQFCEKRFTHSGNLGEHLRRFHGHLQ